MRRICALLVVMFTVSGCVTDPTMWEAAKKDLRGDNTQMRSIQGRSWGGELPQATMQP